MQPVNNSSLTTLQNTKVLDLRLSIHTLTFTALVAGQYINRFVSCHMFGNMLICPFIGTLTCVTAACQQSPSQLERLVKNAIIRVL